MLFGIIGAVAAVTTLTVTFAFFSHISDKGHGAEEQQEKDNKRKKEQSPIVAYKPKRPVQSMTSIPISQPTKTVASRMNNLQTHRTSTIRAKTHKFR